MVPRGEVGLIFASVGLATKALPDRVFVAVLVAVFATTFVAPPMLKTLRPKAGLTTARRSSASVVFRSFLRSESSRKNSGSRTSATRSSWSRLTR